MTHRGPFQPLLFCDSVIPWYTHSPLTHKRLPQVQSLGSHDAVMGSDLSLHCSPLCLCVNGLHTNHQPPPALPSYCLLVNGAQHAAVPSCQSQLQGELTMVMLPQSSPFASKSETKTQRIIIDSNLQCSMHEVNFNTPVNFVLQCICTYKSVCTNTCLQCCIKGHLGTDTEYSLGVQQKRIRKAGVKEGNQNID